MKGPPSTRSPLYDKEDEEKYQMANICQKGILASNIAMVKFDVLFWIVRKA